MNGKAWCWLEVYEIISVVSSAGQTTRQEPPEMGEIPSKLGYFALHPFSGIHPFSKAQQGIGKNMNLDNRKGLSFIHSFKTLWSTSCVSDDN